MSLENLFYFLVICEVFKNVYVFIIIFNLVKVIMDKVSVLLYDSYFYGYRILYKNFEDEGFEWMVWGFICKNVDLIIGDVFGFILYINYSFCVFVKLFWFVGFILELFKVRILEWGK